MFVLIEKATGQVVDMARNMSDLEASVAFRTEKGESYAEARKRYEIRENR